MTLIERYLFRQLLGPATLATLSLGGVALLSQSLAALDIIVDNGQSAGAFIKITLLGLPQLISMILPVALSVATLVSFNRLHTEQEIVVCFAGGMSRWRVIAPALRLTCYATIAALVINLWIHPLSAKAMRSEIFKLRTDLASSMVQEGRFTEPSPGLTVYAKTVGSQGLMTNLFVHQEKAGDAGGATFTAKEGRIAERHGQPVLIMHDGSNQEFSKTGVLNYLAFDEYIFDLAPYVKQDAVVHYKTADRYLHELLFPDLTQDWEKSNRVKMLAEAHSRISAPLYNFAFVLMSMASVLGGAFSRMGYGTRIATIGAAAVGVRVLGFAVLAGCNNSAPLNVLQYLLPLGACYWALAQIFKQKVSRFIPMTVRRSQPVLAKAPA